MAIIKMGGVVTDIVGKVGGTVFQQSTYGTIMRNNRFRRSRQKAINYLKRSQFAFLATYGRSFTQTQRDAFAAAGLNFTRPTKQGPNTPYDWFSLHMAFNGNLLMCGLPLNTAYFDPTVEPDWSGFAIGDELGTTNWQITGIDNVDPSWTVVILASPPVEQYRSFNQSRMRIIQTSTGADGNIVITRANYNAVFGTIQAGRFAWFQVFLVLSATGQRTQPKITKADAQ